MTGKGPLSYDPRPPKERRVGGGDSSKKGRRTRSTNEGSGAGGGGIMRLLMGRSEIDRAKAQRYEPYSYESNRTQLKWVTVALLIWVVVALVLAWQDRSTVNYLSDLRDQGMVSVPPTQQSTQRDISSILSFAEAEGIGCNTEDDIISLSPECARLMDVQDEYTAVKDTGAMLVVLLMAVLLANMFAFGSFTHRASRNVLALNNSSQGFTPEKAVLWFFIPVFNLFKPWQVFKELFRGSDPAVTIRDELAWKTEGTVSARVHIWAAVFVGVFFFNPRTIGWFWYSIRETIDDVIVAHQRLIIADILLALLGVAAIFVAIELHRRQEARHAKVGVITVTPPPPVDSLEEALKEGIRRKELENRRARSKRNDSSSKSK
ncbi:MAG: DUF4328 domain-containing protein [Dehalococcoidia bacterium]|jgi:hypothetical protein|nr:hypothetical protein [Chloroflexota bacterium]MDP6055749.1 DUF4328 domain-containing protein [Dehalococcoidia bacterium]MDP7089778.1 DUF4328 domain-containing protein [Dehalococcoidia bacterium]MDP7261813.1 DUF4328 domain-containing protein [Dehalococcoidia bacterium]MDP7484733.1 DUF4328 domain-containing protein [Dehalococcoidia bacterium]